MTKDELIVSQQLKIAEHEKVEQKCRAACIKIYSELFSIGSPLNDNKLGYTHKQLRPFLNISEHIQQLSADTDRRE